MDGGAWWATVHGVSKSRTRLSDFTHFTQATRMQRYTASWPYLLTPGRLEILGCLSLALSWAPPHNWACAVLSSYMLYGVLLVLGCLSWLAGYYLPSQGSNLDHGTESPDPWPPGPQGTPHSHVWPYPHPKGDISTSMYSWASAGVRSWALFYFLAKK